MGEDKSIHVQQLRLFVCLHSCSVYSILSAFTLALLEDSGWYQANYAVANKTVNDEPIPLLYGKGVCDCGGRGEGVEVGGGGGG